MKYKIQQCILKCTFLVVTKKCKLKQFFFQNAKIINGKHHC